jgi:flagellar motor switch protein FliN/FliY
VSHEIVKPTLEKPDAVSGGLLEVVSDVPLQLSIEIGSARMLLRDVLQLEPGSVVELDRSAGELADVLVNGRLVARGDVTAVGERLAVRIVEVIASEKR